MISNTKAIYKTFVREHSNKLHMRATLPTKLRKEMEIIAKDKFRIGTKMVIYT